jgi:hypothetical protein
MKRVWGRWETQRPYKALKFKPQNQRPRVYPCKICYSFTLKMEVTRSSETPATMYKVTRCQHRRPESTYSSAWKLQIVLSDMFYDLFMKKLSPSLKWQQFSCPRKSYFFPGGGVGLVPKRGCLLTLAYYAFPRWYEFGERRWNDTDRGKPKNSEKNLSQCNFFYYNSLLTESCTSLPCEHHHWTSHSYPFLCFYNFPVVSFFQISDQNFELISYLPYACSMSRTLLPPLFDHVNPL